MIGTVEYIGKCPSCGNDIFIDNAYKSDLDVIVVDDLFECPQCLNVYCIMEIEKYQEELNELCDIMGCGEIREEGDEDNF